MPNHSRRIEPEPPSPTLREIRARVLSALLLGTVVLGGLAYVPSVRLALEVGAVNVAVVDTLIYAGVILLLVGDPPYPFRAGALLALVYGLAVFLLIELGPYGAGPEWLLAFGFLAPVFLGIRGALAAVALTLLALGAVAWMLHAGLGAWPGAGQGLAGWGVISVNLLFLQLVVAVPVALVIRGLEDALDSAATARESLESKRARLNRLNEDLIREERARLRAESDRAVLAMAMEQSPVMVAVLDDRGRMRYGNPAFRTAWGQDRTAPGAPLEETGCMGSDLDQVESIRGALATAGVWSGQLTGFRPDGSTVETEALISPLQEPEGGVVGSLLVMKDVTREVALEAELHQAEKLRTIGTLAGGVAHDFNNLLLPILANAHLARDDVPDGAPPELLEALDDIAAAAERGQAMTRRILDFSRSGDAEGEAEPVELVALLSETSRLLRPSLPKGIKLELRVDVESAVVRGSSAQLHRVLMNLAANAIQAMGPSGTLTLALGNGVMGGRGFHLTVADDGSGIPPEIRQRIFEPYFTTKGPGQGTGLGLATVHGIVEGMGGSLSVDSELGRGTRMTVQLPGAA